MNRDLRNVSSVYLDDGEFLVGEIGSEIVAIGGFRPVDERTVELKRLRARPEHWRRGYGRTLVAALEYRARERGYKRVVLHTSEQLAAARSLYRNLDYRETGRERRSEVDIELVYFEKRLGE